MASPPQSSNAHKRSKSGTTRSLISRVSSRGDVPTLGSPESMANPPSDPSAGASLPPPSPTNASLHPSTSRTSNIGHRPHLSTSMSNANSSKTSAEGPRGDTSMSSQTPSSPGHGASIEQSVRLFKVFEALRNGDTAAISRATKGNEQAKLEGTTILHLAIQCAELAVIEFVLSQQGADVNAKDRDGNTPLHVASMLGRAPIVKVLLDQGDVNDAATNYQGKTALDLARSPEIFQQLQLARSMFIDSNVRKIHQLVSNNDHEGLETLLGDAKVRSTLDVNGPELATDPATMEHGGSLLHEAARKKDTKLAQILLLNGADPFRRDRKGKLPQDVTKDDRTRAILKRSPAAAVAQRTIQEKTILGDSGQVSAAEAGPGGKESREMKGYLRKWTNYTSGYKLRWFVLEDGVLSYYKHQDDAGSACRGAINMRIAKLKMDPKDKLLFDIHGKSSVKYNLKANHEVEAKRWFWALNNAIQWAKDEEREENKRHQQETQALREARKEQLERQHTKEESIAHTGSSLIPTTAAGLHTSSSSPLAPSSVQGGTSAYEPSVGDDPLTRALSRTNTATIEGDLDEDEEYGDDASSHEVRPASRDAFSITAQSARLQLDLLGQVSAALKQQQNARPDTPISHPEIVQALSSYETAVGNLKGLVMDLLRISRDHEAFWQYRLEREQNVRRLWEDSMARVAQEQEELETRIGESEDKRKRTKRALRDALEGQQGEPSKATSPIEEESVTEKTEATTSTSTPFLDLPQDTLANTKKRRPTIAALTNNELSDDEDEDEEEFFDAVDAGEVEVVDTMPPSSPPAKEDQLPSFADATSSSGAARDVPEDVEGDKTGMVKSNLAKDIQKSYKGYEDGPRHRLKLDADNRPKVGLWGILKSMIGKDMTKMTLPVSFNEPTSLLYRVVEDMEYTDLLNTAAERADSTERMVYVAAFAASEYASTIGRVAKPFNPLLGETYEYVRPDLGYRFFIEQVSHHPPVGAAYAESKNWDYYGESAVKSKFYGKSFEFNPLGTWFLRLRPASGGEELYTWKKVTSSVVGIITGNPTVDNYGPMEVKNWTTGEVCILDFKAKGWKASSAYGVTGKVVGQDGKTNWSIGGRWNDKIYARHTPGYEVDPSGPSDKPGAKDQAFLVWEAHARPAGIPFNLTPFCVTLNALPERLRPMIAPTDSRLRPDQRAMEEGEYDFAAEEKSRVEESQRSRRREREARGEEFEPRWFKKSSHPVTGEPFWEFTGKYWDVRDDVAEGRATWEGERLEEIY